jgi:hypothetical protein
MVVSGTASLGMQTLTAMSVGAMMVLAGLGKRRLDRRPVPRKLRRDRFRLRR